MFDLLIILGALGSLSALLYFFVSWRRERSLLNRAAQREIAFEVPVLGARHSGKTTLLINLGHQVDLGLLGDEALNARLLSHREEEQVRGRALHSFEDAESTNSRPEPGRRSTQAMVRLGRELLTSDQAIPETTDIEDLYLLAHLGAQSSLRDQLCKITDVPGDHFADELSYKSNIYPLVDRADGLLLVLDGAEVLTGASLQITEELEEELEVEGGEEEDQESSGHEASDPEDSETDEPLAIKRRQSTFSRYQQITERFMHRRDDSNDSRPIWIVITKSDLLDDRGRVEEASEDDHWRDLTIRSLIPNLSLESADLITFSLVSAHQGVDERGWESISEGGADLLRGLRELALSRQERLADRAIAGRALRNRWLISALTLCVFSWMSWGMYEHAKLPSLEGEIHWDWESLETASVPYLVERSRLESATHPIRLYQAQVLSGLATLRRAHLDLFAREYQSWAEHIGSSSTQRSLAQKKFERAQRSIKSFHQRLTRWEQLSLEERALLSQVAEALETATRWEELKARPQSLTQIFHLLARYQLDEWSQRCAAKQPVACELKRWFEREQRALLSHALKVAQAESESKSARLIQVNARLKPLLRWRVAYDRFYQSLGEGVARDELMRRAQTLIDTAWRRAWESLSTQLKQMNGDKEERGGVAQLRALKAFETQRRALELSSHGSLPMPPEIARAWRDRVNISSVLVGEERRGGERTAQGELSELVSWAEVFLDAKRAARVKLSDREVRWLRMLKESFKAPKASALDQAIQVLQRDLSELNGLEGRLEIEAELKTWRERLQALQAWRAPHKVTLVMSDLSCQSDLFKQHQIQIDGLSNWDTDLIEYYLVIHSGGALVATWFGDQGQRLSFQWSPWMPLSVTVFEQDGEIDHLTQGEDEEKDDDQVGNSLALLVAPHLPEGDLKMNAEGVCSARVESQDSVPKWLTQLNLIDRASYQALHQVPPKSEERRKSEPPKSGGQGQLKEKSSQGSSQGSPESNDQP